MKTPQILYTNTNINNYHSYANTTTNKIIDEKEGLNANEKNDLLEESYLLNLTKEEIIQRKNKKIKELEEVIDMIIKENEEIKESYAESVCFFKNYIEILEEDLRKTTQSELNNTKSMFITDVDVKDIKDKINSFGKEIKKIGNFEKCDFCDEILLGSMLEKHVNQYVDLRIFESYIVKDNNEKYIVESIKHGFDVNIVVEKEKGNTILHILAINGNKNILQAILSYTQIKVNYNCANKSQNTPLHLALENNNNDVALLLIDIGVELNKKNKHDLTPLMICCERNNMEIAKKLVSMSSSLILQTNILGENSIKICERNKNEDLCLFLLSQSNKTDLKSSSKSIKLIK